MSSLTDRLHDLANRLRDSGRYSADNSDVADATLIDEAIGALPGGASDELNLAREALLFVLPYVHVDIRAQALAIYSIPQTPLEKHIGELGLQDQPSDQS